MNDHHATYRTLVDGQVDNQVDSQTTAIRQRATRPGPIGLLRCAALLGPLLLVSTLLLLPSPSGADVATKAAAAMPVPPIKQPQTKGNDTVGVAEIQAEVLHFVERELLPQWQNEGMRVEVASTRMDERLTLQRCAQPLRFEPQPHNGRAGRLLVKTHCDDQRQWSIFVPVDVQRWRHVVTTRHAIARNTRLAASDLQLSEKPVERLGRDSFDTLTQAIGMQARRALQAGQVLNSHHIERPKVVKRGDSVMISAEANGISARMPGVALADGRRDEQIRVRNTHSKRIIKARVAGPGEVSAVM